MVLVETLALLAANDGPQPDYEFRTRLVFLALAQAQAAGLLAGVRLDPEEPEWPVVYIELPTGQVSWHVPQHGRPWDRHSKRTGHDRLQRYVAQEREALPPLEETVRAPETEPQSA